MFESTATTQASYWWPRSSCHVLNGSVQLWVDLLGLSVRVLRLNECLPEVFNLALQTTGFEPLAPERILSRLGSPVQLQHGVGRPADGKQDDAGDLHSGQQVGHGSSEG